MNMKPNMKPEHETEDDKLFLAFVFEIFYDDEHEAWTGKVDDRAHIISSKMPHSGGFSGSGGLYCNKWSLKNAVNSVSLKYSPPSKPKPRI